MPVVKTSKEEILKKAFRVFLEKGYYHTSVSDLSRACNIEKPHFYYYFKNKQDLMISILRFVRIWAKKNLFAYAYNETLEPRVRLERVLNQIEKIHTQGYWGCIFSNTALETANNDDAFLPVLKIYFDEWLDCLKTIFSLKYDNETAENLALGFFEGLNGTLLMVKVYRDYSYLKRFRDKQLNLL